MGQQFQDQFVSGCDNYVYVTECLTILHTLCFDGLVILLQLRHYVAVVISIIVIHNHTAAATVQIYTARKYAQLLLIFISIKVNTGFHAGSSHTRKIISYNIISSKTVNLEAFITTHHSSLSVFMKNNPPSDEKSITKVSNQELPGGQNDFLSSSSSSVGQFKIA